VKQSRSGQLGSYCVVLASGAPQLLGAGDHTPRQPRPAQRRAIKTRTLNAVTFQPDWLRSIYLNSLHTARLRPAPKDNVAGGLRRSGGCCGRERQGASRCVAGPLKKPQTKPFPTKTTVGCTRAPVVAREREVNGVVCAAATPMLRGPVGNHQASMLARRLLVLVMSSAPPAAPSLLPLLVLAGLRVTLPAYSHGDSPGIRRLQPRGRLRGHGAWGSLADAHRVRAAHAERRGQVPASGRRARETRGAQGPGRVCEAAHGAGLGGAG
jgi:hypothetical protein